MINIALIFLFVFIHENVKILKAILPFHDLFLNASPKLNAHTCILLLFLSDIQHVIGIDKFDMNVHMQQQKQYSKVSIKHPVLLNNPF